MKALLGQVLLQISVNATYGVGLWAGFWILPLTPDRFGEKSSAI